MAESPEHKLNQSFIVDSPSDIVPPNMPDSKTTVEIPLDQIKEKVETSQSVDFMNGIGTDDYIRQPTAEAKDLPPLDNPTGPTIGSGNMQRDLNFVESNNSDINKTAKDFEMEAGGIVEIFDWIMIVALKWASGDDRDSVWAMTEAKKKKIIFYLSMVLFKYKSKFKIEYLLAGAIVAAWSPSVYSAYQMYTERKKKEKLDAERKALQKQQSDKYNNIQKRATDVSFQEEIRNKPNNPTAHQPISNQTKPPVPSQQVPSVQSQQPNVVPNIPTFTQTYKMPVTPNINDNVQNTQGNIPFTPTVPVITPEVDTYTPPAIALEKMEIFTPHEVVDNNEVETTERRRRGRPKKK